MTAYRLDLYSSILVDCIVTTLSMQEPSAVIKNFRTNNRCGESTPVCAALSSASSWLFEQQGLRSALLLAKWSTFLCMCLVCSFLWSCGYKVARVFPEDTKHFTNFYYGCYTRFTFWSYFVLCLFKNYTLCLWKPFCMMVDAAFCVFV